MSTKEIIRIGKAQQRIYTCLAFKCKVIASFTGRGMTEIVENDRKIAIWLGPSLRYGSDHHREPYDPDSGHKARMPETKMAK